MNATAIAVAGAAILLAGCAGPDSGVESSRVDRTVISTDPIDPAATSETTTTETTTTATIEESPAPAVTGPGSVSADDLGTIFLSTDPDLVSAADVLVSQSEPSTFIQDTLSFTGSPTPIIIAGAPITNWTFVLSDPEFDGDVVTEATGITTRYRMTVELTDVAESLDEIDVAAEALRDELRPVVEAAYPDDVVRDTLSDTPLGNQVHGLAIGPEDQPTTHVEVSMQYLLDPLLVNDQLLGIRVTRRHSDVPVEEFPARSVFVDDALQSQIDLLGADPAADERSITRHVVSYNIPSAGAPTVNRFVGYDYSLAAGDFESFVADVAARLETGGYTASTRFGDSRVFGRSEERIESEFTVDRNGDDSVLVGVQGDIVAFP